MAVARLICHTNLKPAGTSNDIVPLILAAECIEIGDKFDSTEKDVVSEIICLSVTSSFGLIRPQVDLQGYLGVA